jgi:hypothetical protein
LLSTVRVCSVLWILIWTALLVAALVVWFVLGRRLLRQAKALGTELGTATERLEAVSLALSGSAPALGTNTAMSGPAHARPGRGARRSGPDPATSPEWDVRRSGRRARR